MPRYLIALTAAAISSVSLAQGPTTLPSGGHSPADAAQQQPQDRPAIFDTAYRGSLGAAHQFATDTDPSSPAPDDSDFSLTRYGAGASVHYALPGDEVLIDHALIYEFDDYDFSGTSTFSRDLPGDRRNTLLDQPWDDTHLLNYSLTGTYLANRNWSVFAGPILGIAAENGADLEDSFTWGITAGVRQRINDDLSVGLGFVIAQGVEQEFSGVPILLIDWKLSDNLSLRNGRPQPGLRGTAGVELAYALTPKWELSTGAAFDRREFRLDDEGAAPGGVGRNSAFPLYLRVRYIATDDLSIVGLAGLLLGGELRLEDRDGHQVGATDYDTAPFIGAAVAYKF